MARDIAAADRIEQGRVCVLSGVESCRSYEVHRDAGTKRLELKSRPRRCLHLYHYFMHQDLGLMHVRVQTWMPFNPWVCLNGRAWLARQMDRAGIGYRRRENCFVEVADPAAAQAPMDLQLKADWPAVLNGVAAQASPGHVELFGPRSAYPIDPYWSAQQSEWATDVMFKSPALLAALYPRLVRHGIETLGSRDVLRFLGKGVPAAGNCHPRFKGQVVSDLKQRPEGLRIKHRVNGNSVKVYDKQGPVLRVETTINDPRDLKVYRGTQEKPADKAWRPLRKGVADLHRQAQVSRRANERYLAAMAAVDAPVPPQGPGRAAVPARAEGREAGPGAQPAVARGRGAAGGGGPRGVHAQRVPQPRPAGAAVRGRRRGVVTRKLRLPRAHGLVEKVPKTHRYLVTGEGRRVITALLAARRADADALARAA